MRFPPLSLSLFSWLEGHQLEKIPDTQTNGI
jgi:hypothetical protein